MFLHLPVSYSVPGAGVCLTETPLDRNPPLYEDPPEQRPLRDPQRDPSQTETPPRQRPLPDRDPFQTETALYGNERMVRILFYCQPNETWIKTNLYMCKKSFISYAARWGWSQKKEIYVNSEIGKTNPTICDSSSVFHNFPLMR